MSVFNGEQSSSLRPADTSTNERESVFNYVTYYVVLHMLCYISRAPDQLLLPFLKQFPSKRKTSMIYSTTDCTPDNDSCKYFSFVLLVDADLYLPIHWTCMIDYNGFYGGVFCLRKHIAKIGKMKHTLCRFKSYDGT